MASVSKRDLLRNVSASNGPRPTTISRKPTASSPANIIPICKPANNRRKQAEEKFKEINEAYEHLSDQDKRKRYDMFGHAGGRRAAQGLRASTSDAAASAMCLTTSLKIFSAGQRGGSAR